jgi:N-acetylated-alpha-linked acidic dipeptidase
LLIINLGIAGGAGDPNSGSATLNEVVRSFGKALATGWKPLRTIVFASWDGEEYGLVGSTEWVEQYVPWLSKSAVAYINVDVSTQGPHFKSAASPLLNKALYEATSLVQSPNQTIKGQTVRDVWDGTIRTMGSGSDFTAFQDFAGIPSLDFGFGRGSGDSVYHYHSNYDSFHWMEKYGDVGFKYHTTASKVMSLLTAKLVQTPIIPLSTSDYAKQLLVYIQSVQKHSTGSALFENIREAINKLTVAAELFDHKASVVEEIIENRKFPWWKWWQKAHLYRQARRINTKYKLFERQFLHIEGLDGRPWFKHIVFAPGKWTGYAGATFPGLVEALDEGDRAALEKWSIIIEEKIKAATKFIK